MKRFQGDLIKRERKRRARPQPWMGLDHHQRPRLRRVRGGWAAETRRSGAAYGPTKVEAVRLFRVAALWFEWRRQRPPVDSWTFNVGAYEDRS